jgi:sugar/nucleoside kinase (ribokinase family)
MTHALDVVTFGEAMMLLVGDRPGPLEDAGAFLKRTAGAETNVAIGLARLGLRVGWASRLGTDMMGRYLIREMRAEGIDCAQVALVASQPTGFMIKGSVNDGSDPPIEYHRKGSAASHMGLQDLDSAWLLSARHLHATGIFPAISASTLPLALQSMELMRGAGRSVSFDPNLRPALWASPAVMVQAINDLAARADWVLPGLEEGRLLTGEPTAQGIARFYRARGAKLVVVKLGAEGAYFDGEGGSGQVPGFPVEKVVDTVGAGDGFAVGVISGLLAGLDVPAAVSRGAWIGARAVQVRGDTEGLPTRSELAQAAL